MQTKFYGEYLVAADADVLTGTELEYAPTNGVYIVKCASTVNTATLAVKTSSQPEVSPARAVVHRANGEILVGDTPWIAKVQKGDKVTLALAGTTGTCYLTVSFVGR